LRAAPRAQSRRAAASRSRSTRAGHRLRERRLRGLSAAPRRHVAPPDHRHQRGLRAGEPRARPGHRQGHARDVVGKQAVWDGLGPGRLHGHKIGHPYQGNNYFNAGRANGLGFYESAALTAFGSATWEFFGETNHASLNDFINTTLGGITLGEMFHRAGWLIRNTRATGKRRLWSEIGATALDPITGLNRFASGDSSRVTDKPSDLVPSSLSGVASAGVLWGGGQSRAFTEGGVPFLEVDAYYGDANIGRSRTPYDAFWLRMRFGGGSWFSEARGGGRLFGQPLGHGAQFSLIQTYNYLNNDAYSTGSQAIDAGL